MKAFLVIVLCVLCPGCSLLGYLVGHAKGHSLGARAELTSTMVFLTIARARIEKGENASAVEAIDKGLDAASDTILKFEESGPKPALMMVALRSGPVKKQMADLRSQIATTLEWQRSPVPEKVYLALNVPVVPGNRTTSASGEMPMIPAEDGGATNPAPAPRTTAPAPAPKQPQLPPGIERRQR
ncbi:hypothetical protein OKA05_07600 [Luteolibacter arcticus]|uniref:Uncharacterized protein n=1 Tax=Luteolibacter arcticus TaxID=1581411 RepID=A0ABT3GFS1_9BACT|nr:hypothetical protein [Luteolibacter arcticus]MCW1922414.1 hypothetical protein [Luteolibacter arcticus]